MLQKVRRVPHPHQNRSDHLSVSQPVDDLVGGVGRLEIREDEHVGLFLQVVEGENLRQELLTERGPHLHVTVDRKIRSSQTDNSSGLADLLGPRVADTPEVGEGNHRDPRRQTERQSGVRALHRYLGELFRRRLRIDRAIAVDDDLSPQQHEEDRGNDVRAGRSLDDLQSRANGVGRGMHRAGDQPVRFVQLDHHRRQDDVVAKLLLGHRPRDALVLAALVQRVDVVPADFGRVDDLQPVRQEQAAACGDSPDAIGIGDQSAPCDATLVAVNRRIDRPRLVALGQEDAPVRGGRLLDQPVTKRMGRGARFPFRRAMALEPVEIDMPGHRLHRQLCPRRVVRTDFEIQTGQRHGGVVAAVVDDHDG